MSFKIRKLSFELSAITDLPILIRVNQIGEKRIQITMLHVERINLNELDILIDKVERLLYCNIYTINWSNNKKYVKLYGDVEGILKFLKENEML